MADGTYINELFVPRVFKRNAAEVAASAEETIDFIEKRIIAWAYGVPSDDEKDTMIRDVEDTVSELIDLAFKMHCAAYIQENPDLCIE